MSIILILTIAKNGSNVANHSNCYLTISMYDIAISDTSAKSIAGSVLLNKKLLVDKKPHAL